jgi:hypothetical protein
MGKTNTFFRASMQNTLSFISDDIVTTAVDDTRLVGYRHSSSEEGLRFYVERRPDRA